LNKNNNYRDQIEYKTLTLTRDTHDIWTFKKKHKNHEVTHDSHCSWSL